MAKRKNITDTENESQKLVGRTEKQKEAINALRHGEATVLNGPAGCGKTYLAASVAAEWYLKETANKLVLTRPVVPTGRSIGYFPGTILEKMQPWCAEFLSVFAEAVGHRGVIETGIKNGRIEIIPLEVMRGRSFRDSFVVMDEAQNSTPEEALMFWTRIADTSRVAMLGDQRQTDMGRKNGLAKSCQLITDYELPVKIIDFSTDDIVRDSKVALWIDAFYRDGRDAG